MRRWAYLITLIAACDTEDMALTKQIASFPIVGGLATKTGPLVVQPGSFLTLDNVRSERAGEWRNRTGFQRNALDDALAANPPLRSVELPGGGWWGLTRQTSSNVTSAATYAPSVPSTAARWRRPASSAVTPGHWTRREVSAERYAVSQVTLAVGNGFRLVAWKPGNASIGQTAIRATIISDTEGITIYPVAEIGNTAGNCPKAVYDATSGRFLLFWLDGANLNVAAWSGTTGAIITSSTTLKTNVNAGPQFLDAHRYAAPTVTVVYRNNAGGNAHQLEVDGATLALSTDLALGVGAGNALGLIPNPDGGTTRFIVLSTLVPEVRVLRTDSAAAILTNEVADTIASTKIVGCAYQSGASWMIVYQDPATSELKAVKKYSGAVGGVLTLTANYGAGTIVTLDSNAWRESGTDAMRYMAGIHIGDVATAKGDFQATFYEMALEYDNGSATIGNPWTEAQAKFIPQSAGRQLGGDSSPAQVVRVAADKFAVVLPRFSEVTLVAGLYGNQYVIDTWDVNYMSTAWFSGFAHPNLGQGEKSEQASYIPAGNLLQSVNGQSIEAHGAMSLPWKPTCALSAGAGLTSGAAYQYIVTVDYEDAEGNAWRGPPSVPSNAITPSAGNLQVTVTIRVGPFERAARRRLIKLWRTTGNGAVYQLAYQTSRESDPTNCVFTVVDAVTDGNLALSDFLDTTTLPAQLTPGFNHVAFFDGRMWGAERDFTYRLRFSHVIRQGISPEFPGESALDVIDENGPITGLRAMDDKLLIFKGDAIYFIAAGGPNDDGSGGQYQVTRVSSGVGAVSGTPTLSIGSEVWFFSAAGWYTIDRSFQLAFVGEPIDRYFNQSLAVTPEMPIAITYSTKRNEIRILSSNYRFVYDTVHECWIRDTGAPSASLGMLSLTGTGDALVRSNGQFWWDYDTPSITYSADPGGSFQGVIRFPWLKLAKPQGYMRIYSWRSVLLRIPGTNVASWPTPKLYYDDDDAISETYTQTGTTNPDVQRLEQRPSRQRCTSFSPELTLPTGDVEWRLNEISILFGIGERTRFIRAAPSILGRSNPPAPPGMLLWLKHDIGIGLTTPPFLNAWADQSGNGYDAVNAPPFTEPQLTASPSGTMGVRFAVAAYMNGPTSIAHLVAPGAARTLFVVATPDSAAGGPLFQWSYEGGAPALIHEMEVNGPFNPPVTQYGYRNGLAPSGASAGAFAAPIDYTNTMIACTFWNDATDVFAAVDGATRAITPSAYTPELAVGGYCVGCYAFSGLSGHRFAWSGWIHEVIAYAGDKTTDAPFMAQANEYLHWRYPALPAW